MSMLTILYLATVSLTWDRCRFIKLLYIGEPYLSMDVQVLALPLRRIPL